MMMTMMKKKMMKQEFLRLLPEEVDRQSHSGFQCSAGEDLVDDEDEDEDYHAVGAKDGQQAHRLAQA